MRPPLIRDKPGDARDLALRARTRVALGRLRLRLAVSRRAIDDALDGAAGLAFVRSHGNTGDQLIEEGIRILLGRRLYDEVSGAALGDAKGDLAFVAGGGAWCQPYHEFMPELLPELEARFRRVVILPSSFDANVTAVRRALSETKAVVFARERDSYEAIRGLCDARLAHDCAFYFDFSPHRRRGNGVLNAFRTDPESRLAGSGIGVPAGNRDISSELSSLDTWLAAIGQAEVVRTDRAHVMIAGAMLGKRVEALPSSYHKVPAIVSHSLRGFPVRLLSESEVAG